ncbi:hypothetical protein L210DRAFT_869158, partial [Boletus edulis BED1]
LRRTNKLIDNWSTDFKEVVRRYDFCPSRPEFPLAELKNILGGRCVNLDAALAYHYASSSTEKHTEKVGELEFSFASANFTRSVEPSAERITAWGRTERAYRFIFPFRVDEFRRYGEFISQMLTQHQSECHFRVILFDKAVRKRVGSCRSLLFTGFAHFADLQASHFFPSGTQYNAGAPSKSGGRTRTTRVQRSEACRKFNQGTCRRAADACKYAHICLKCSKPHRETDCRSAA